MKKVKTLLLGLCALLVIIIALQNTESVDTRLLFMTVTMPRALLLLTVLLVGFVAGLGTGAFLRRSSKQAPDGSA